MSLASLANTTVVVQRVTQTQDASGGVVSSFATHLTLTAWVYEVNGSESLRQGREMGDLTHVVRIDGDKDILPSDRIKWTDGSRTRYLDIVSVRRPRTVFGVHHVALDCRERV